MNKTECKAKIKELDKTLSVLKEGLDKADHKEKTKWMERINSLLDDRFVLMQLRDKRKAKTNE